MAGQLAWVSLLIVCLFVPVRAQVDFGDWQCGSEDTSRRYAYDTVNEKCPMLTAELNHCCVVHDECYVRQMGQDKCDKEFCECNAKVMNSTDEGQDCRLFTNTVCALMPLMGMFAYDASINYTEPADLTKNLPISWDLHEPFYHMYSSCPKVNSTTSSCAILYNNCDNEEDYFCAAQLCSCVQAASSLDKEPGCHHAVHNVCKAAHNRTRYGYMVDFFMNPLFLALIGILVIAVLALVYYRKRRDSVDAKLIKYSTVSEA